MNIIIYPNTSGGFCVLIPNPDSELSMSDIANKDIPKGTPYNIINKNELPSDNSFRDAWTYDFSTPDGYSL